MDTIKLIGNGDVLEIPKVCLGSGYLNGANLEGYNKVLDAYFEGHNFIDTARVYGNFMQNGKGGAEEAIGNFLKSHNKLHEAIIATKGGHPSVLNMHGTRLSKNELEKDINQSLKFLQRDYTDIYFLHRDGKVDLYELMSVLNGFVKEGKTRHLGASNWTVERIKEANEIAEKNGFAKFEISQICFSLAEQTKKTMRDTTLVCMTDSEEEKYREYPLPVMAFSSLSKGFFSKYPDGLKGKAAEGFLTETNAKRAERVAEIAEQKQVSKSAIAGRYLMDYDIETVLLFGASSVRQLEETLEAESISLTKEEVTYIRNGK